MSEMSEVFATWVRRAKALGFTVAPCDRREFSNILREEGFPDEDIPHIGGLWCDDEEGKNIYILTDQSEEDELRSLIHEVLHAERPDWDEGKVHLATDIEMEAVTDR